MSGPGNGFSNRIAVCFSRLAMGQKLAKKELEKGETLFDEQRFDDAVGQWVKALKRLQKPADKFQVCGKICLCLCDIGKYREALTYAGQQCELANALQDMNLLSEAYFHLALCNEKSCEFSKAISYSRSSQQAYPAKSPLTGQIHLCLANAFTGTSEFVKAWINYVHAMDDAKAKGDNQLQLLTSSHMGHLFCLLGDYESSLAYCNNAMDLLDEFRPLDPVQKYRRRIVVEMAVVHRKTGRFSEAMDSCEDAMKLALLYADRPVQARCLLLFADIHRKRNDLERASPRYESAYSIMSEIGDRLGQVEVLGGMAKTAVAQRHFEKATELNEKGMDLATRIGNKLEILRCHARLQYLCDISKEKKRSQRHNKVVRQLVREMDLYCGVCDEVLGQTPDRLEPLTCGHFTHAKCAIHLARSTLGRSSKRRPCPACRHNSSLNPVT